MAGDDADRFAAFNDHDGIGVTQYLGRRTDLFPRTDQR